jgi:hypothetical protein
MPSLRDLRFEADSSIAPPLTLTAVLAGVNLPSVDASAMFSI